MILIGLAALPALAAPIPVQLPAPMTTSREFTSFFHDLDGVAINDQQLIVEFDMVGDQFVKVRPSTHSAFMVLRLNQTDLRFNQMGGSASLLGPDGEPFLNLPPRLGGIGGG